MKHSASAAIVGALQLKTRGLFAALPRTVAALAISRPSPALTGLCCGKMCPALAEPSQLLASPSLSLSLSLRMGCSQGQNIRSGLTSVVRNYGYRNVTFEPHAPATFHTFRHRYIYSPASISTACFQRDGISAAEGTEGDGAAHRILNIASLSVSYRPLARGDILFIAYC